MRIPCGIFALADDLGDKPKQTTVPSCHPNGCLTHTAVPLTDCLIVFIEPVINSLKLYGEIPINRAKITYTCFYKTRQYLFYKLVNIF
jgi:hypothetical protein